METEKGGIILSININIPKDFTKTPGGRHISEGEFSGEEFREKILYPKYQEAKKCNCDIVVILDGGFGYGPSFLEEAFGGLARKTKDKSLLKKIIIISDEEPKLKKDISEYIKAGLEN